MSLTATRTIEIKVNRAEAMRDLSAIQKAVNAIGSGNGISNTSRAFDRATKAANDNARAAQGAARGANDVANASTKAARAISDQGNAAAAASRKMSGFAAAANTISTAVLVMAAGATAAFVKLTDTFNVARSRIALAANSAEQFNQAWRDTQAIALSTNSELESTATLYGRLLDSTNRAGRSQAEAAAATKVWSQALRISGSDTMAAASATRQLTQGLASGTLRGDELVSVLENNSFAAQILADKFGVTTGKLRELGAAGKISSKDIIDAFSDPAVQQRVQKAFDSLPATFSAAMTNLKSTAVIAMGEFSRALMGGLDMKSIDFASMLEKWIPTIHEFGFAMRDSIGAFANVFKTIGPIISPILTYLKNNLDKVAWSITAIVAASLAMKAANMAAPLFSLAGAALSAAGYVTKLALGFGTLAKAQGISTAMTLTMTRLTTAIRATTVAQIALNIATMANPYVLVAAAIIAVVGALGYLITTTKVHEDGMATYGDVIRIVFGDFVASLSSVVDWLNSAKQSVSDFMNQLDPAVATAFQVALVGATGGAAAGFIDLEAVARSVGINIGAIGEAASEKWASDFENATGRSIDKMGEYERYWFETCASIGRGWDTVNGVILASAAGIGSAVYNAAAGIANASVSVFNWAMGAVTSFINSMIAGVNLLIGALNAVGANLSPVRAIGEGAKQSGGKNSPLLQYRNVGDDMRAGFRAAGSPFEREMGRFGAAAGRTLDGAANRAENENHRATSQGKSNRLRLAADPTVNGTSLRDRPSAAGGGGGSGNRGRSGQSDAAREAERAAEAAKRLQENIDGFWAGMAQNVEQAQRAGIELENYNDLLKIREIYGERWAQLSAADQLSITNRINALNRQAATSKAVVALNDQIEQAQRNITAETERQSLVMRHGEEIGNRMFERQQAQAERRRKDLQDGVDILSDQYLLNERTLAQRERELDLLKERNAQLNRGAEYARNADRERNPLIYAAEQRDRNIGDLNAWIAAQRAMFAEGTAERARAERQFRAGIEIAGQEFNDAVYQAGQGFRDSMRNIADALGEIFGEKVGAAANGFASLAELLNPKTRDKAAQNSNSPFARLAFGIGDIAQNFGGLGKSIANLAKGAGIGAAIGSAIAPIGKMFSKKFSSTGSQIGGMIGGMTPLGPVGAVIGSVLGGVVGGLFKKTKKASQQILVENGKLVLGAVSGNSGKFKQQAAEAGSQVVSGIYSLASELGADLNGNFSGKIASIGIRKGNYRVDPTGGTATKVKKGAIDFGKDGLDSAVAYVVRDAVKKGILTGLTSFSDRILKASTDDNFEARVALAKQFESLNKEMALMADPVGGGIAEISKSLDALAASMKEAGATTAELAKVEAYRGTKINAFIDEQLSSLNDFKKTLFGDGMGVTKMSQFLSTQREYNAMKAKQANGETVDTEAFTTLASEFLQRASAVYGTSTSQFQAIRNELIAATDGRISDIEKYRIDNTAAQLNRQTELQEASLLEQEQQTLLMKQQNELLAKWGAAMGGNFGHGFNQNQLV